MCVVPQTSELREYASRMGWTVTEYAEKESSVKKRPVRTAARVEASESADFNPLARSQGTDDTVKYGANDGVAFLPRHLNGLTNLFGQIGPGHLAHPRSITKKSNMKPVPTMPDEERQCYELMKRNFRNPDPATTTFVGTVRGLGRAQRAVEVLDGRLKPEEREAGFSHYHQEGKTPEPRRCRRHRRPA